MDNAFYFQFKKPFLSPHQWTYSPILFVCYSVLLIIFVYNSSVIKSCLWYVKGKCSYCFIWIAIIPVPLIKKTILSSLRCCDIIIKNQATNCVCLFLHFLAYLINLLNSGLVKHFLVTVALQQTLISGVKSPA